MGGFIGETGKTARIAQAVGEYNNNKHVFRLNKVTTVFDRIIARTGLKHKPLVLRASRRAHFPTSHSRCTNTFTKVHRPSVVRWLVTERPRG